MKKAVSFLFIFIFSFFLFSFSSAALANVETIEKEFSIDGSQPVFLEFRDRDGSLNFTSWDKDIVRILVKKEIKVRNSKKAERLLRQTEVDITQKENSIRIKIKYPKMKGIFLFITDYQRVKVSTEIMLPPNSNLSCTIDDGSITGEKVEGDMIMKSDDGTIRLTDIQGSVNIATEDGRIVLKNIEGKAKVKSDDGDIMLSGRLSHLRVVTEDGDIKAEILPYSIMEADWKIKTDDGDIDIFLFSDFSASILLKTDDGDIDCQVPVIFSCIAAEKELSGKINQGGHLLSVSTEDGDITLRSLI